MEPPKLVTGLLIALVACALTLGAQRVLMDPGATRPEAAAPGPEASDSRIDGVIARLEALSQDRGVQLVAPSRLAEPPSERRALVEEPSDRDEIQEILARLSAIERRLNVRPALVREMQPLDRLRAPDVVALRAATELQEADREAFEHDLHMRTMHEIVDRFGYPTSTEGGTGSVHWRYEIQSADPENPNFFSVNFREGLVIWIESRWTD